MAKPDGRITDASIKTCSGQFDLESVFTLSMCRMGLRNIENLDGCSSLTHLDLSHNRIRKIEALDGLRQLKRLVLIDNEIESLCNVESLASLETLSLQAASAHNVLSAWLVLL